VAARHEAEFITVPGANDARVGGIEAKTGGAHVGIQALLDTGDEQSLADGTTLMRAGILVSVKCARDTEKADGCACDVQHDAPAIRYVIASGDGACHEAGFFRFERGKTGGGAGARRLIFGGLPVAKSILSGILISQDPRLAQVSPVTGQKVPLTAKAGD